MNNLSEAEHENLSNLSQRLKSSQDKFFIILDFSIYEGTMKVAKGDSFPVIPFKDSFDKIPLKIKFLNVTQDKNPL